MRDAAATPAAHARPFAPPGLILFVAVSAMSWGGPLTRLAGVPALAIAAWRLGFSTAIVLAIVLLRGELHALRLAPRDVLPALGAGLLLAAHFWSWIASLELTSVASSVVLVNTQPIFVGLLSVMFLGERPARIQWLGILVAVTGAGVIGWGDFGRGRSPLLGDLLSLSGAVFVAGYYIIGRHLRQRMGLWSYTGAVYGIAALVLAVAVLLSPRVPATGYATRTWLILLLLAAGPMMVGHTGVNYALRFIPAYVANVALLGEPIGATLIAWLLPAIGERPPLQTLGGGGLILTGIALGMRRRRPSRGVERPARPAMAVPEQLH
jgi:drug/metabolite transporter (DMT)-like permease